MKVYFILLAAMAFICSYNPSSADYRGYGRGENTCGAFISSSEGFPPGKLGYLKSHNQEYFSDNRLYIEWAEGFITSILSRDGNSEAVIKDVSSFDLWLRNWCNAHPTNLFLDAVVAFVRNEGVLK